MDQRHHVSSPQQQGQTGVAAHQQNGASTNKQGSEELLDSFNRLSLATSPVTNTQGPPPLLSPLRSASQAYERGQSRHHDSPSRDKLARPPPTPRRTPSSSSLRDERRRSSTPGLQKKSSVSSLRSVHNSSSTTTPPRPSLSRRSSSNMLTSPAHPKSPLASADVPAPPPLPTASSIAADYFKRELAVHQSGELQSRALVIMQDACYGHRYSRPRTSKAGLESIVERPERLQAGVLGLATAYIRIGKRYQGGSFAPHPDIDLKTLPVPPFQIRKTSRTLSLDSPAVTHIHGTKWMDELRAMCDAAESRLALNGKELVRPSNSGKDDGLSSPPKLHEGDLYLCAESLNAFEAALGGVCDGVDSVFGPGSARRAFVCIRPPGHHCSANYPSGFCWLNNVHVGIAHGAMAHGLTHAAIIDFDLHHGDGSQAIAWEQNRKATTASKNAAQHKKTAIGYFSLHDINSYPCEGGDEAKVRNASVCIDNAHGQSAWNVHLEPWKTTSEFWKLYNDKYLILLKKARAFLRLHSERLRSNPNGPTPKAAIFLSAGFDASEWEGAGMQRHKVNVPTDFYARFTADVVQLAEEEGLDVDGRVISVLEGGYSDRALISGVLSHLSGLADTRSVLDDTDIQTSRLASEMLNRLGLVDNNNNKTTNTEDADEPVSFDSEWWSAPLLEELEKLAYPPPPAPVRKTREKGPPTYSSPTQASAAKIVTPTRERKSLGTPRIDEDAYIPPPLPPVDWATAAVALSKCLIPTDRQVMSCQHSDLKVEVTRQRRDRHSVNATELQAAVGDRKHMRLRERKPKAPSPVDSTPQKARAPSGNHRRTTIGSVSDLPEASVAGSANTNTKPFDVVVPQAQGSISLASDANLTTDVDSDQVPEILSRPSSKGRSMSSRPSSSTSGKASESLAAKKPRAVSSSRAPATSTRSSPRKPSSTSSSRSISQARSVSGSETPRTKEEDKDIENLSLKVRRIKLKVSSPEEIAAREKKAAEERKKVMSKTSRKPQTSKTSKTPASFKPAGKTSSRPGSAVHPEASPQHTDPVKQEVPSYFSQENVSSHTSPPDLISPLSVESRPTPDWSASITSPPIDTTPIDTSNTPVACVSKRPTVSEDTSRSAAPTPAGPENPPQQQPQPQITVKSPPRSTSYQLPVFTSTSAIPFAPSNEASRPRPLSEGGEPQGQ